MRVTVRTPSRLHLALIDLNGELGRVDGSLGVALAQPGVFLEATLSSETTVSGSQADLVRSLAKTFLEHYKIDRGAQIHVSETIPSHVGLGSTTQISLAVASALANIFSIKASVRELAEVMGRGGTSGVGVAAFERGGLILDGGHRFGVGEEKSSFLPSGASKARPAPLLVRYEVPRDWFFVVAVPNVPMGAHGEREVEIFRERCPIPAEEVGKVCRIIMMVILPAIVERDLEAFGEGLNVLQEVGIASRTRDLRDPTTWRCIDFMLDKGAYGAGQSSFGPAGYGLVEGEEKALRLTDDVTKFLRKQGGGRVFYSSANNTGAKIEVQP